MKSKFPFWSWLASSKSALFSTIALHIVVVLLLVNTIMLYDDRWIVIGAVIVSTLILAAFWEKTAKNYYNDNL